MCPIKIHKYFVSIKNISISWLLLKLGRNSGYFNSLESSRCSHNTGPQSYKVAIGWNCVIAILFRMACSLQFTRVTSYERDNDRISFHFYHSCAVIFLYSVTPCLQQKWKMTDCKDSIIQEKQERAKLFSKKLNKYTKISSVSVYQ